MSGEPLDPQADNVRQAISSGVGKMVAGLVALDCFTPEAIVQGTMAGLLQEAGRLRGERVVADFLVAAMGAASANLGQASAEVAEQHVREMLPELRQRIESGLL